MKQLSLSFVIFLSLCATANSGEKTISYCDHGSYPPFSWMQDNQMTGAIQDTVRQLFEELGYTLNVYALESWKRCMIELELGNIDIAVAYKTEERNKKLAFSEEYLFAEKMAVFVNKEHSFNFNQWQDLNNKRAGLVLGYSYGGKLDKFLQENTTIEYVSSSHQNFNKLALNRIDFVPFELSSGLLQVQTLGHKDKITPFENIATTDHLYISTAKTNQRIIGILPRLNKIIKRIKNDGTVDTLVKKHYDLYLQLTPTKH